MDNKKKSGPKDSIINALLIPSADVLGREMADSLSIKLKERRRKTKDVQDANIAINLKCAFNRLKPMFGESTYKCFDVENEEQSMLQLSFLDEWADAVKDVDPSNESQHALSNLWQSVLAESIASGHYKLSDIEILKNIRTSEAVEYVKFKKKKIRSLKNYSPLDSRGLSGSVLVNIYLLDFDLIRRATIRESILRGINILMAAAIYAVCFILGIIIGINSESSLIIANVAVVCVFITILFMFIFCCAYFPTLYTPTQKGWRILAYCNAKQAVK